MPDLSPSEAAAVAIARRTRRIRAEAAVWVVRIDAGRAARDDSRLLRWCARSAEHRAGFDAALEQWRNADALREAAPAPAHAPAPTSVPADTREPRRHSSRPSRWRFALTGPRAAFASLLIAGGLGAALWLHAPDFATRPGEMRTLALADGSVVRLDADSAIDVRYSPSERRVVLARGRAAFDVRHGDTRRFVVQAGGGETVDIGTAFQVSTAPLLATQGADRVTGTTRGEAALVTVTQGRVAVRNPAGRTEASAGQSVAYGDASHAPGRVDVDLFSATAWQRGRMVFADTPLAEVVAALNRYWPGHLVYVRGRAASLHVSGNFATDAPAQAVATLAETLRLQSTQIAGRIVLLSAADSAADR
ncbi:FecR family protein [Paraburkholderia acidisoli]|uniref:FecR protein domain-containing protein n=1 Tax=Paraburkholderia acidisoli TaxID=2571748 RepID=A0A7Z2JIE4_9BURK|nr:FecR domain-containing protein [Paraburkholderia acidisoli]QGZ65108.1 hypothetical protein FAZ98_25330 [Paraburkholderia acidisoli]